jgi:hypothetical protein
MDRRLTGGGGDANTWSSRAGNNALFVCRPGRGSKFDQQPRFVCLSEEMKKTSL